jgi:hypothetical protein
MSKVLKIRIAEVTISIEGNLQGHWEIFPAYRPFMGQGKPDIRLRLHQGIPEPLGGEKVFDCPPIWTLYRQDGASIVKIFDRLSGLQRTLVLSEDLNKTDLYFSRGSGPFNDPFYGPTMELLMMNYLARGRGGILHASGIARNGKGVLFVGESGAGKSTLAGLWNHEEGVSVLSDDRIIIRKHGDQFWIYGTPWHGEAKFASPGKARLEKIFFLRHGQENRIKEIKGIDQVARLLACAFPTHWDPRGMAFSLEIFTDLAARVPCQELHFRPDKSAIRFVERII